MNKKELLAYAEENYPIDTTYICEYEKQFNKRIRISERKLKFIYKLVDDIPMITDHNSGAVYWNGVWAVKESTIKELEKALKIIYSD